MTPEKIFVTVNGKRRSLQWLIDNAAAATVVRILNNPGLTSLPDLSAATDVWIENNPGLTSLPDLSAATVVRIENNPGLTSLPDLSAATDVWIENNPGLGLLYAGKDSRNYEFYAIRVRGQWRVVAGCRNLNFEDALKHWGPRGESNRPDCLALVQKLIRNVEGLCTGSAVGG